MSSNNDWETVSNKKGSKNVKTSAKKDHTSKKQRSSDGLPRIEPTAPVKESPTIYQAFLEEELRKERKLLEAEKENANKEVKKSSSTQKRKDRAHSLKDCLAKLEIEDFESILKKDQIAYPKCPNIWLRDIASFLNSQLDHIPDLDPIIANKPRNYPISELPEGLRKYFNEKISSFTMESNLSLLDYCIESLTNNVVKDQSCYGYRLFIQLLLHYKPALVLDNLNKFESLIQRNTSRPIKALAILWSVGQVGVTSLDSGVKVWFGTMFTLVNVRNLNNYIIQYLETLFQSHGFDLEVDKKLQTKKVSSYDCVSKTDYFKYLGELYSESSTLSRDLKTRLKDLYPYIKKLAWGDASKNLSNFFPGYLSRCTSDCSESKKKELLECLVQCLQMDHQSFVVWGREYKKNISQSCLLLQYINMHASDLKLKKKLLNETIKSFQLANEELALKPAKSTSSSSSSISSSSLSSSAAGQKDLDLNIQLCDSLSSKHGGSSKKWKYLFILMFLPLLILFAYDVHHHGSLHNSLTYKKLSEAGVLAEVDKAVQSSKQYLGIAHQWISSKTPECLMHAHEHILPYVESVQRQIMSPRDYIIDATNDQRQWVVQMFDHVLNQGVAYMPTVLEYLESLCEYTIHIASVLFENLCEMVEHAYDYLSKSVFVGQLSPENIKESLSETVKLVQSNIHTAIVWIKETTFKK